MTTPTGHTTVAAKLEETRRRLLDMSRRNRLLNHRTSASGTLRIAGEHPDEVYRILVAESRRMQFLSREEAPAPVAASLLAEETAETGATAQTFALAPLDEPGAKAEHQTDTRLQTALDGERLQTRLLHLAREATSSLEEQGTNILYLTLGMVEWRETADGVVSRAPLVFVPVELARRSVNSRHTVARFDDDVATNPSLVELCKRQFAVDLPVFDPDGEEAPTAFLDRVATAVAALPGWRVLPEIHVGLFSFAKLLMYRDLDAAAWPAEATIAAHPIVGRLSGLDVDDPTFDGEIPDPATLDDTVPPDECYQVLDADSSQQAAILAAKRGLSAVVEGPPGTGKSQTITNIIAECLSEGRTVLFVAEKAAALDVVRRRLESVGLGDFVLELHSRKASKRAVLDGLRRSLDADAEARDAGRYDARKLEDTRSRLNAYVRELHGPVAPLGLSPFEVVSRAVALSGEPEARCLLPGVETWTSRQLSAACDLVGTLDLRLARVGDAAAHPWRGAGLTAAGLEVEMRVRERAEAFGVALDTLARETGALARTLGAPEPESNADVARLVDAVSELAAAPSVNPDVVDDARWNALDPELGAWIAHGVERARAKARWAPVFDESAEAVDWRALHARRRAQQGSLLRFLTPSWYLDGRALGAHYHPGPSHSSAEKMAALDALVESGAHRAALVAAEARFAPMLRGLWSGIDGDWERIRRAAGSLVNVRALVVRGAISPEAARRATTQAGRDEFAAARDRLIAVRGAARRASDAWTEAIGATDVAWYGESFDTVRIGAARERLTRATSAVDRLGDVADVNDAIARAHESIAWPFVEWALSGAGSPARGRLARVFERHVYRLWIDRAFASLPALAHFRGEEHEALVERFRALDAEWLEASKRRLSTLVRSKRPDLRHATTRQSKLGIVQAEIKKQRNIMPLRRLFSVAGDVVQAIAPCFMMSPISVAQYLQPGAVEFDVVIFDEASQVEPADAYGAIARGRQVLLVGDERQLPPTNFFSKIEAEDEPTGDADPTEFAATDLESILAVGAVRLPNRCRLRWHYRSRHASLIEFSNERFYDDAPMRVFPSPHTGREELGVAFRFVEGGEYKRGAGQHNPVEAAAVAREVVRHAVESPELSLGVGAFSMPQQRAIQDEIERIRRDEPDERLEAFVRSHADEPFFVKNLETIQGDERDVILLSVGYGPDAAGKITMNFGPLNRDGGWRRLNVLVTRARQRCLVFSSLHADQMSLGGTQARGVAALKDYLYYAERGRMPSVGAPTGEHDSPFERDVARALAGRGWEVHAQVGSAGFSIDLAVVDPEMPGRYLLGIECDGATYHGSATARDRDRLRQAVLEGLGWKIHRVWSTDWFHRRDATLARLVERIETARREEVRRPPERRAPELVEAAPPESEPEEAPDEGVEPYLRSTTVLGDHEALVALRATEVGALVAEIVREESPVHAEEALRALAARFETRASKRTQEAFARGLAAAEASGAVSRRGEFLWHRDAGAARVRRRGPHAPVTKPEHIAPEELEAAVRLVLGREFGIARDPLVSGTARLLGFSRAGASLAAAIEAALDRLIAAGEVTTDANGFLVLRN